MEQQSLLNNDISYNKVKPIFKYIGGKTWLAPKLNVIIDDYLKSNKNITTYSEWFCGALGAFLGSYETLIRNNIFNIELNDINRNIVNLYRLINIGGGITDLINHYIVLEDQFHYLIPQNTYELNTATDKIIIKDNLKYANEYYKQVRDDYNFNLDINSNKQLARLLFLLKHGFNGLYRENSKGFYNTPFNWNTTLIKEEDLLTKLNNLYKVFSYFEINFHNQSFENLTTNSSTLLYLDPPYIEYTKDSGKNNYSKTGFNLDKQYELINKIKNSHFIYSNYAVEDLTNKFNHVNIEYINRKNLSNTP